jgi:hypothetical protein
LLCTLSLDRSQPRLSAIACWSSENVHAHAVGHHSARCRWGVLPSAFPQKSRARHGHTLNGARFQSTMTPSWHTCSTACVPTDCKTWQ